MSRTRHLLSGLVALAALLLGLASTSGTAHADSDAAPVRVMPLGDSITDGFNVPGGYRVDLWQKLVAGGHEIDFVGSQANGPGNLGDRDHEGHSGWTIAQIDSNITNWLKTYAPDTILLHIGTNDMYGGDPGGAPARLATLIDRITAQAPDTHLFVSTIVPLAWGDQTVRTFNAAIPGIVQSRADAGKRVHLVEMYSKLTTADLADGVHPNATGYSKMATAWYEALLSVPGSIGAGGDGAPAPADRPANACATASETSADRSGAAVQREMSCATR